MTSAGKTLVQFLPRLVAKQKFAVIDDLLEYQQTRFLHTSCSHDGAPKGTVEPSSRMIDNINSFHLWLFEAIEIKPATTAFANLTYFTIWHPYSRWDPKQVLLSFTMSVVQARFSRALSSQRKHHKSTPLLIEDGNSCTKYDHSSVRLRVRRTSEGPGVEHRMPPLETLQNMVCEFSHTPSPQRNLFYLPDPSEPIANNHCSASMRFSLDNLDTWALAGESSSRCYVPAIFSNSIPPPPTRHSIICYQFRLSVSQPPKTGRAYIRLGQEDVGQSYLPAVPTNQGESPQKVAHVFTVQALPLLLCLLPLGLELTRSLLQRSQQAIDEARTPEISSGETRHIFYSSTRTIIPSNINKNHISLRAKLILPPEDIAEFIFQKCAPTSTVNIGAEMRNARTRVEVIGIYIRKSNARLAKQQLGAGRFRQAYESIQQGNEDEYGRERWARKFIGSPATDANVKQRVALRD
ncbi:uncharacterized protein CLUP02_15957 [Colletotrichum lupini]|uniref:Uncharacterized protein n=1 Tax=Colletotrichum lupini TaxID=145971 RepID=A0A9Q8WPI2_9PEZI|nr:uncharacterized protein CLUP02_15957 [Colletotrichum lupini]UQC90427.1 hypothetical protein CLUP02_15957 [Colletotrichum lupini]